MARSCVRRLPVVLAVAGTVMVLAWGLSRAVAQQGGEKTFANPGDAALALYNAVKANDQQALNTIFGSHAGPILHSGDEVADKNMAADFIRRYDEMHRVVIEPDQGCVPLAHGDRAVTAGKVEGVPVTPHRAAVQLRGVEPRTRAQVKRAAAIAVPPPLDKRVPAAIERADQITAHRRE